MTRYNRLINFLNKFNMLSNNQYGFRKNHSTAYALIQLYDTLSDAIDLGKVTLGLFIDLPIQGLRHREPWYPTC